MSELRTVGTYSTRLDAEQAASILEANGIDAMVKADDGGGAFAGLSLSAKGVRLLVLEQDEAEARAVLEGMEMLPPPADADGDEPD